jgi:hypothetical protein
MRLKNYQLILAVLCCNAVVGAAYQFDANDFAVQVIDYNQGNIPAEDVDCIDGTPFTNPANALGRPTIDTTGDGKSILVSQITPVVGIYAPFRSFELVTIGCGGRLILKFNHPVADDRNNPYGIDFIIFGNAQQSAGDYWRNGDPAQFYIQLSSVIQDPALVLVSQTGDVNDPNQWYPFTNGPFADTWAPTFGRIYDPCNPDTSIGSWNHWWAEPTNPTVPLDPNLGPNYFRNNTVAFMSTAYGQSAGGTGFDLEWLDPDDYQSLGTDPCSGEKWIQYVWIQGGEYYSPEVDSVSDVACCGDYKHTRPSADIDNNCTVDELDLALLTQYWLDEGFDPDSPPAEADIHRDGRIDFRDFAVLAGQWRLCTWQCEP